MQGWCHCREKLAKFWRQYSTTNLMQPSWLCQSNLLLLPTLWDWMLPIREAIKKGIFKEYFLNKGGRVWYSSTLCEILVAIVFGKDTMNTMNTVLNTADTAIISSFNSIFSSSRYGHLKRELIDREFLLNLCCFVTCDLQKWKNKQDHALIYLRTVTSAHLTDQFLQFPD